MLLSKTLKLLAHFFIHIIVGVAMFVAFACAALGVWEFTNWMKGLGAPAWLLVICHAVAYLLFGIDVICATFFVLVEGVKFVREVWDNRG